MQVVPGRTPGARAAAATSTFTGTGTYGVRFRLVTDTGSRYVGGYSGAYWVKSS